MSLKVISAGIFHLVDFMYIFRGIYVLIRFYNIKTSPCVLYLLLVFSLKKGKLKSRSPRYSKIYQTEFLSVEIVNKILILTIFLIFLIL